MDQSTPEAVAPEAAPVAAERSEDAKQKQEEGFYGGKFKTKEEFEAGHRNLEKALEERGFKSNLVDRLIGRIAQEQNVSQDAALEYLSTLSKAELKEMQSEAPESQQVDPEDVGKTANALQGKTIQDPLARAEVKKIRWELGQDRLLRKYPDAERVLSFIEEEYTLKGEDPVKIYEKKVLPLIEEGKALGGQRREEKQRASVTVGSKPLPPVDDLQEARLYAESTGDWKPYIKLKTQRSNE